MTDFLQWTAWPMTSPAVYGPFHLLFFTIGTAAMLLLAWIFRTFTSLKMNNSVLAFTGVILAIGEIYKQLFFYYIIGEKNYDWWLFPFQLCSLPMYLCLLLPFIHNPGKRQIICTFLLDFNMMGAIATFIDPSGILHDYWTLTLHGLIWHLILIFIGFFIILTRQADLSPKGFKAILPLFAFFCIIAEILNIVLHQYGAINLFYISPYEMSTQLVFSDIDRVCGRLIGIILYILAMIAGAYLIHTLAGLYNARHPQQIDANRHGHNRTEH